jgi:threonine dehydratase
MLPTLADIEQAAERLVGRAVRTPLLESPLLNEAVGGRVLVKAECLQVTGSFKFRGAFNRISVIPPERRAGGVVAISSGNHSQGVALAARQLGLTSLCVMPSDAPAIKVANTRAYGAEIHFYDRATEDREAIGRRLVAERGATLVLPFDDPHIVAGQGTVGLELVDQAKAMGAELDAVLTGCSGGGLATGIATAVAALSPGTKIHTVEPAGFDDMARSLAAGSRQRNEAVTGSICDALLAPTPGEIPFAIGAKLLANGLTVSDEEVCAAMRAAFRHLHLVVEPGGAVGLAALLAGRYDARGRTVAVIASGGNVDDGLFATILNR